MPVSANPIGGAEPGCSQGIHVDAHGPLKSKCPATACTEDVHRGGRKHLLGSVHPLSLPTAHPAVLTSAFSPPCMFPSAPAGLSIFIRPCLLWQSSVTCQGCGPAQGSISAVCHIFQPDICSQAIINALWLHTVLQLWNPSESLYSACLMLSGLDIQAECLCRALLQLCILERQV